jgi:hypothetical protein
VFQATCTQIIGTLHFHILSASAWRFQVAGIYQQDAPSQDIVGNRRGLEAAT